MDTARKYDDAELIRLARREYNRQWQRNNRAKARVYNERYWLKRGREMIAQQNTNTQTSSEPSRSSNNGE